MPTYTNDDLAKMILDNQQLTNERFDKLPDDLQNHFDDRYVKHSEANGKFITRLEGKVVTWIFTIVVTILGVYAQWKSNRN